MAGLAADLIQILAKVDTPEVLGDWLLKGNLTTHADLALVALDDAHIDARFAPYHRAEVRAPQR